MPAAQNLSSVWNHTGECCLYPGVKTALVKMLQLHAARSRMSCRIQLIVMQSELPQMWISPNKCWWQHMDNSWAESIPEHETAFYPKALAKLIDEMEEKSPFKNAEVRIVAQTDPGCPPGCWFVIFDVFPADAA